MPVKLFETKPIIGVIHLGRLPGQPEAPPLAVVIERALDDARNLEAGGAGALLIENWKDESPGPFVDARAKAALAAITQAVVGAASAPVGLNVLPNDYRAAFELAARFGARFVQLDVFSDAVRTDYSYSQVAPFEVRVDFDDVRAHRARAEGVALLASVHPKHYALLEPDAIEESARRALAEGADALVVTGVATGSAPSAERVRRVKQAAGDAPVFIGSGLGPENAADLWPESDGAIVGTAIRTKDFSQVVVAKVQALVSALPG